MLLVIKCNHVYERNNAHQSTKRENSMKDTPPSPNICSKTIELGPPDAIVCRKYCSKAHNGMSLVLYSNGQEPLIAQSYADVVTKAAQESFACNASSLTAFLEASARMRTRIRQDKRKQKRLRPQLASLAIVACRRDELQIAWSGDIFAIKLRNGIPALIAHPSRAGRIDFVFDPLGSAPALGRYRLCNGDFVFVFTASLSKVMLEDDVLWMRLVKARTLCDASRAAAQAVLRSRVNIGACHIIGAGKIY